MIDHVSNVMFARLHGHVPLVVARWSYSPDDPFAVRLSIHRSRGVVIDWLMSRELLLAGLSAPAGIGVVRVAPSAARNNTETLEIRIGSHGHRASLTFDRAFVERFLDITLQIVPTSTETATLDMDVLIGKLSKSRTR
jgi:hypothetical protein